MFMQQLNAILLSIVMMFVLMLGIVVTLWGLLELSAWWLGY